MKKITLFSILNVILASGTVAANTSPVTATPAGRPVPVAISPAPANIAGAPAPVQPSAPAPANINTAKQPKVIQGSPTPVNTAHPGTQGREASAPKSCRARHRIATKKLISVVHKIPNPKLQSILLKGHRSGISLWTLSLGEQQQMKADGARVARKMKAIIAEPRCRSTANIEAIKAAIRSGDLETAVGDLDREGGLEGIYAQLGGGTQYAGKLPRPVRPSQPYSGAHDEYQPRPTQYAQQYVWWHEICYGERYTPWFCDPLMGITGIAQ